MEEVRVDQSQKHSSGQDAEPPIAALSGRELDAAVAERVMGLTMLGDADCDRDPDCGGLEITPLYESTATSTERHPVFLRECYCADYPLTHVTYPDGPMKQIEIDANARNVREYDADVGRWGHARCCLGVVPHYSTEIAAAMEVVEKMYADGWAVEMSRNIDRGQPEAWEAGFYGGNERKGVYKTAYKDSLPLAVCIAALAAHAATEREAESVQSGTE